MSVVELKTFKQEINDSVIDRLEVILALAREGKVSAVAIAVLDEIGASNCAWSKTDNMQGLLGSISRLEHRFNMSIDEQ